MPPKRACISAVDAIMNIMQFVENEEVVSGDDSDDDLDDINGDQGMFDIIFYICMLL